MPKSYPSPTQEKPAWISETLAGMPAILTLQEAAKALRQSTRNVRREIERNLIQPIRCEGKSRIRIPRAELGRYLQTLAGAA
jgi:excisionase family DNA binding protein